MTCDKCPEEATWGYSLQPVRDEVLGYCAIHAQELQGGIQSVKQLTLVQRQNLLGRLRPIREFQGATT